MKKDKWVVVVLENEEVNCILNGTMFDTEEEADQAIREAEAEDERENWGNYSYSEPLLIFA